MAKRKRKPAAAAEPAPADPATKIASLLALIATKDMDKDDAALKLDAIGFNAHEISALLDVGSNYVFAARHRKKTGNKQSKKNAG